MRSPTNAIADEVMGDFDGAFRRLEGLRRSGALSSCGVADAVAELESQWCRLMAGNAAFGGGQPDEQVGQRYLESLKCLEPGQSVIGFHFLSELNKCAGLEIDESILKNSQSKAVERFENELRFMGLAVEIVKVDFNKFKVKYIL